MPPRNAENSPSLVQVPRPTDPRIRRRAIKQVMTWLDARSKASSEGNFKEMDRLGKLARSAHFLLLPSTG